jgi:hypothetical protein
MILLELPDDLANLLEDYAHMMGLLTNEDNLQAVCITSIRELLRQEATEEGPESTERSSPIPSVSAWLDKVLGNNPTIPSVHVEDTPPERLTQPQFAQYAEECPNDTLVLAALQMSSLEQEALATVYNVLGSDAFSTKRAKDLWVEQVRLIKGST